MLPFDNLSAILLVAIPALLNIGILYYLIVYLPKGKAVNIFAAFLLSVISWQCFDVISRLDIDLETMQYAEKFLNVGWLATGPLLFHFVLLFTKKVDWGSRRIFIYLYLPLLIVHGIYVANPDYNSFVRDDFWGWVFMDPGFTVILARNFVAFFVLISLILLFHHAYINRHEKEIRLQSLLIATGILIPSIAGTIAQIIYPIMTGYEVPVTSAFFTFLSIAIIISLGGRYQLFSISESINIENILQDLSAIVLIVDPNEQVIYKNKQAKKYFSKSKSHREFSELREYFAEQESYHSFQKEIFIASLREKDVDQYDTQLRTAEGKILDVSLSSELIINNNVKQGLLLIATDITKRKKAKKERKEILESITDGFFAVDNEWTVTYWNRAAEEILLMPKENVLGENLWDVYADVIPLKFYEEYHIAMEKQEVRTFEEYYPTMNLWLQVSAFPKKDGLTVFFKDITKDKNQELEILRIKQNREAMINSTDESIWAVNKELHLIAANEPFYEIMEELTGFTISEGDYVLPEGFGEEMQKKWKKLYHRALKGERFNITEKTHLDGEERYSMISFNPIQNDKEECIGVACYSKDISDRMKYINAIERQNEKLKSIAWTQSHVVRAPLSRLMGLINIIKMGAIEKNELDEYLGHLKDAAKELDQVIHDIVEKTKEVSSNGGAENMDDRR